MDTKKSNKQDLEWVYEQQELEKSIQDHGYDNKDEISKSDKCICVACKSWFLPNEIKTWHEDRHAVCPNSNCGLTGVVIGSASGINLDSFTTET